jgi:hypothetical protein
VAGLADFSALDSNTTSMGLEGCMVDGMCRYRGDVIAQYPDDNTRCGADCSFAGEARYVGYVVPRDDESPVSITIPNVIKNGATEARLALAATYPWFEWNGVDKPPTAITLRYRLNRSSWHERAISEVESHAFSDFSPDLGGAGHGAGLLNQIIEIDPNELKDGDNILELQSAGTWTGSYRAGVAAIDLILATP